LTTVLADVAKLQKRQFLYVIILVQFALYKNARPKLTRIYPTAKKKHPISSWFGGSHATPRPSVFRQWLCGFTSVEYSLPLNSRDVVVDQGQKRLEIAGMAAFVGMWWGLGSSLAA